MNDSNNKIKNTLQKQSQNLKNKHSKPNEDLKTNISQKSNLKLQPKINLEKTTKLLKDPIYMNIF